MHTASLPEVPLAVDREGFSAWISRTAASSIRWWRFVCEEVTDDPVGTDDHRQRTAHLVMRWLRPSAIMLHAGLFSLFMMRPRRSSKRIRSTFTKAYRKSRYDKGDADYINCAMDEAEFDRFYDELIHAETR